MNNCPQFSCQCSLKAQRESLFSVEDEKCIESAHKLSDSEQREIVVLIPLLEKEEKEVQLKTSTNVKVNFA